MTTIPSDTYHPETDNSSAGRAILIVTANDTEDLEFFYPYYRFIEAGFRVDVVTPKGGEFKAKHGLGLKDTKKITDVDAEDYELLYIPGGKAPAELKKDEDALDLTREFVATGRPVAAICHGPQLLAAADVISGKKISGWPEIEDEIREAGASYVNQETVTDGQFITARMPADLPAHVKCALETLGHAAKEHHAEVAA